jgi:hypothetical protein
MKTRRGLSTVVGAVFAVIVLATTFAYVTYSMNTLSQYNNSVLAKNQQLTNNGYEKFQIASVAVTKSKLNITLANTGNLPINFTKIWIQNTTTTDWVRNYTQSNSFVAPGATLTNLGQSISAYINPSKSYNVKLVTSRGNSQSFTVNSPNATKLNIQLLALPSTVSSGFTTELVMIVTNNSTGMLVNVSPNSPTLSTTNTGDNPTCTAGSVSPASYNTLPLGGTITFKWDITLTGNAGDTCTATFTQPLQNGYSQTVTSPAITVVAVSLSSTTYSQNAGVITASYTSFLWSQGSTWNKDWSFPNGNNVVFSVQLTNNNQTSGGYSLWFSQNSQLMLYPTTSANAKNTPYIYCIVNSVQLSPLGVTAYNPDYNIGIANQGGTGTLYFGANAGQGPACAGSNSLGSLGAGTYTGTLVLYGKFTKNSGDTSNGLYAQQIALFAVKVT